MILVKTPSTMKPYLVRFNSNGVRGRKKEFFAENEDEAKCLAIAIFGNDYGFEIISAEER